MAGRNPDDFPGRWITVTEAIGIFGVSERTIRRRIATGLLPTKHEGNRVLIYLYDKSPEESQAAPGSMSGDNLEAEVRRLTGLLSQVESERDFLRQALAAAMSKIPQVEARASEVSDVGSQAGEVATGSQAPAAPERHEAGPLARWWRRWWGG